MTYLTTQEIKDAVEPAGREGGEFYETHPEAEFDELLATFEEESRAVINGQIMGEGYERETGRVDTLDAPDKPHIQLSYPVDTVSKVEIQSIPDGTWETLDTELYHSDDKKLELRHSIIRNQGYYFNVMNPLRRNQSHVRWSQIADRLRVTYDRGYETANIPEGIKEIQRRIIRRMLVHLRQEQNLANLSPDDVQNFNTRQVLTDDIKDRVSTVTQSKNKYVMLR